MESDKLWWQSKTIWGSIVTTVSLLLYLLGIGPMMTPTNMVDIVNIILLLFGSGGIVTTVYGRVTATKEIVASK